ncbi:hypothetical protein BBF96_02605 [Anoxybacter fermentans]|uniref:Uncharacterized protein n=1 Tax=Anoxybacter fermentans TaxID=1323375 RepID=A0A3S9SVQ6_9FIRM|nr:hypothetical protein [Anoxybacter fermentans]AZR72381.1 hypothetical protein BBF96_02605 [Anoxybacter fermentans]
MAKQKKRRGSKWIKPTRATGRKKERYCRICGTTASQVRIMKHENICELCVRELSRQKGGKLACKGCGKVVPKQVRKYKGYCKDCICRVCGKPDPEYCQKTGFCRECSKEMGICRVCGKEAMAQVEKNDGLCDACAKKLRRH